MSDHFNKLSPAEAERLAYLMEECAEVQQCIGKILRHGYDSYNPHAPEKGNNRQQLIQELRDLAGAIARMEKANDLGSGALSYANPDKGATYMHHQHS